MKRIDVYWVGLAISVITATTIYLGIEYHHPILLGTGFPIYFCGLLLIANNKSINNCIASKTKWVMEKLWKSG